MQAGAGRQPGSRREARAAKSMTRGGPTGIATTGPHPPDGIHTRATIRGGSHVAPRTTPQPLLHSRPSPWGMGSHHNAAGRPDHHPTPQNSHTSVTPGHRHITLSRTVPGPAGRDAPSDAIILMWNLIPAGRPRAHAFRLTRCLTNFGLQVSPRRRALPPRLPTHGN